MIAWRDLSANIADQATTASIGRKGLAVDDQDVDIRISSGAASGLRPKKDNEKGVRLAQDGLLQRQEDARIESNSWRLWISFVHGLS